MSNYISSGGELIAALDEINAESKTVRFEDRASQHGSVEHELSILTQRAIKKLQSFLDDCAKEVTIYFVKGDNGLQINTLDTGPQVEPITAFNKLNTLLKGTSLEKTDTSHGFDAKQTEAILKALPELGWDLLMSQRGQPNPDPNILAEEAGPKSRWER